jgi:hypothetical protein
MLPVKAVNSVLLVVGVCLGLCVGCGGSSSEGPKPSGGAGAGAAPDFTTTVPGDKQLSMLSDAEVTQLCKDFDAYFAPGSPAALAAEEAGCRFGGLFLALLSGAQTDAAAQSACKATYDSCIAAPSQSDPAMCTRPDATCTATVAEEVACLKDSAAALNTLKDALPSCSALSLSSLQNLMLPSDESATAPSCAALKAKCPTAPMPPANTSGMGP